MKKKNDKNAELFFPYYVNQARLLDIYAILNKGYSEYEELSENVDNNAGANGSASAGFKLLKISSDLSVKTNTFRGSTEKKVQTVTSILSMVLEELKNKKYIKEVIDSKAGDFIEVPVILRINSINSALNEISEVISVIKSIEKLGTKPSVKQSDMKQIETISKAIKPLVNFEEIVFEDSHFAIVGNIVEKNLYQANKSDIINTELTCLAQIKKVFPNGTELMKNSALGKFKDKALKESLTKSLNDMLNNDSYDFSSAVISSIDDKPVYEIEIVALYQKSE